MPSAAGPVPILIAEESATQGQSLVHILEQHQYVVSSAPNGRLALEAARRSKPALLISDVIMPEMDGYELCRQVKADAQLRDIPVILVTPLSEPLDVIRGLECGADHFILKPYTEPYLLNRVNSVLANRAAAPPEPVQPGIEVVLAGEKHSIKATRLQILNLLLSTYDAADQRNKELRIAQENLGELNAKLQEVNKELESFAYSISHDLQAPVRAIGGFAQLLVTDTNSQLSEEDRQLVRHICKSAQHLTAMIRGLLDLSRAGRQPLSKQRVDVTGLVRGIVEEQRSQWGERELEVRLTDLPECTADYALLRQVWVNLISNAVKYTRNAPKAVVEIGGKVEDGSCIYFVRDNGVGFDMKYADKLFGVFQRLHGASEFEGTGVGLSIVHRIIERHGGKIRAESGVGQGATFTFCLPGA